MLKAHTHSRQKVCLLGVSSASGLWSSVKPCHRQVASQVCCRFKPIKIFTTRLTWVLIAAASHLTTVLKKYWASRPRFIRHSVHPVADTRVWSLLHCSVNVTQPNYYSHPIHLIPWHEHVCTAIFFVSVTHTLSEFLWERKIKAYTWHK